QAARDPPRQLDVRGLVDPDRDRDRAVHEDVGGLQHRVAEEAVGREIAVPELLALLLEGRGSLEPGHGGEHAEEEVELRVLLHPGLPEERGARGVEPDREPVEHHLERVLLERLGRRPVRRERVPVGDEEEAAVRVLETEPVLERPVVVAEVLPAGRPRAADDDVRHRYPAARIPASARRNVATEPTTRWTTLLFITM